MSSELSSKTVAELKLLLKESGLSTDGKKAELVQRLQEHQEQGAGAAPAPAAAEQQEEQPQQQSEEQSTTAQETKPETEQTKEGDGEEESTLTVIQPKEPPKQLSAEERKELAISLLEKKIKRAEKFGDEQAANEARKDLKRVEKFGVELGTALAREIGLVDKTLPNRNRHNRRFNRGFKKSNRKGK
ncbi:Protein THO1 [Candida viswanathii]|uniref:Protein THO1 n=1 Tax=Candida viswanathii TaxID=5486 RepID=A0A367YM69_9ASCO|nr:Protein THO1 [Candida viswanathii]